MKSNKIAFSLIFLCIGSLLSAEIPSLEIGGVNFEFGADARNKTGFLENYDLDRGNGDQKLASDIRLQSELDVTMNSPLYLHLLLELENINLDADLTTENFISFECRELFAGYKNDTIKAKLGIIELNTPGSYIVPHRKHPIIRKDY